MNFYKFQGPKRGASMGGGFPDGGYLWESGKNAEIDSAPLRVTLSDGGGKKWFDVHGTDASSGIFIFSEKVVRDISELGLTGIDFYPVEVDGKWNKKLDLQIAPKYYWGNVTGQIAVKTYPSPELSKPSDELIGDKAHPRNVTQPYLVLDEAEWSGDDFVRFSTRITGHRFVTERVLDMVRKHAWTNFAIYPLNNGNGYYGRMLLPPLETPS